MKVHEIAAVLEDAAPLAYAYEWDKPGLAIGDPDGEVGHVLACLNINREVFIEAGRLGAQMIVSHHPPIWKPLARLDLRDAHTRLCLDLVRAGIHCYSAHTNLDVAPVGLNAYLAKRLGLDGLKPLIPVDHATLYKVVCFVPETHLASLRDAVAGVGAGVIGEYTHCTFSAPGVGTFIPSDKADPFSGRKQALNEEPERRFEVQVPKARLAAVLEAMLGAHPYEEPAYDVYRIENRDPAVGLGVQGDLPEPMTVRRAAEYVKEKLEIASVRIVGDDQRTVRRAGLLAGSGGGELRQLPRDVALYITGDVRYHDALDALEMGVAVIDAGHDGLEKWAAPALAGYLNARVPELEVSVYYEPPVFRCI